MKISKSVKKLMSVVMMMALVFTSLAIAPKQAKAAEDETTTAPSVEVLGATLRLDNVAGKQSMRFAIKINNASAAKNCSITLTHKANNKSVTLQTGKGTADNIYDYNKDTDKLIYTAVITGIDVENFSTEFDVSGKVESLDETWSDPSSTETKSINSVVKSINSELGSSFFFDGSTLMKTVGNYDFEGSLTFFETFINNPNFVSCNSIATSNDAHDSSKAMEIDSSYYYGGLPLPDLDSLGEYTLSCYVKKVKDNDSNVSVRFRSALDKNCDESCELTDNWQQLKSTYTLSDMTTTNEWNNKHTRVLVCPISGKTGKYLVDDVVITKKVTSDDITAPALPKSFNVSLTADNLAVSNGANDITYEQDGSVSAQLAGASGGGGLVFFAKPDKSAVIASDYSKLRIVVNSKTASAPLCITLRKNASTSYWDQSVYAIAYSDTNSTAGKDTIIEIDLSARSANDKENKFKNIPFYGILIKNNQKTDGFDITIKSIEFIA